MRTCLSHLRIAWVVDRRLSDVDFAQDDIHARILAHQLTGEEMKGIRAARRALAQLESLQSAVWADDLFEKIHDNLNFDGKEILELDRTLKPDQIKRMSQKERENHNKRVTEELQQLMENNWIEHARLELAALEGGFKSDYADKHLETMFERLDKAGKDIRALDRAKRASIEEMDKRIDAAWEGNVKQNPYLKSLDAARFALTFNAGHYAVSRPTPPPAGRPTRRRLPDPGSNIPAAPQAANDAPKPRILSRGERIRNIQFEQLKMKIARKASMPS